MTMTDRSTVVGVFADQAQAEQAVEALERAGFTDQQIGFVRRGEKSPTGEATSETLKKVAPGAIGGGVLGGIAGAAASLLIPGFGPAIAGGILAATLGGAAIGAAAGGLIGALTKLGVPEEEARYYQEEFEAGRTLVIVKAANRQREAADILHQYGAYDATSAQSGSYASTTDSAATARAGMSQTETEGEQRLKLREEQLRAQKQPVETGEARLRKDVVSEQQMMDVPVTHEEVYVESRPGSGQPSDTPIGESETYRVPVHEEQVTTSKQTVETGEVAIGKQQVQDTQRVTDTVRREEAHIEHSGEAPIQGSDIEGTTDQTTP
jgi:uncharacterized protein (TIGR02271 family)